MGKLPKNFASRLRLLAHDKNDKATKSEVIDRLVQEYAALALKEAEFGRFCLRLSGEIIDSVDQDVRRRVLTVFAESGFVVLGPGMKNPYPWYYLTWH